MYRLPRISRRAVLSSVGQVGSAGALLVPLGIPLAACSGPAPRGESSAAASQPATVGFYSRTSEQEAFTKRVAQFHDQYPKIKIDYQALPGTYPEVIRTHAAAGTLADVLYLQNLVFEGLAVAGDLQSIDALVRRDKVDLGQWYESAVKGFTLDTKLYGLPARGQIQNCYVYYNRDAFQRAGVREPDDRWTLDDMVAAADKLTARGDEKYGYGTQWGAWGQAVAATRRFGGDVLSADGKRSVLDSPQALQAMQWHWDLWHRRQAALVKSAAPEDFGSGKVAMLAMTLAGQRSNVKTAVKDGFKWTMVLMPKGPSGKLGADLSIAPVALNTRTKFTDQGFQVVKWFTDKETGIELALQKSGSNTPGARKDVYCDARVTNDPEYPPEMLDRVCKAMELAPQVPYSVPWNYRQPDVEAVIKKHMDAFMTNATQPSATTMRAFHTELQAVLDRPRTGQ